MIRLGIIGTAGRKPDESKILSRKYMEWMVDNVKCYIHNVLETTFDKIILVSGGSAWSDHIAVQLYLYENFGGLKLYIPADFIPDQNKYENTHEGCTLNFLHKKCQINTGYNVFAELSAVVKNPKVQVTVKKGFFQRNTLIAKNSDHLIAFTFSSNSPNDGGTFDTWKKVKHDNKLHISLSWI
jgi:hypothetical protein